MTLTEYLAAGSFPANVSEMPNSWNPAWAKSLVDALAADHATQTRPVPKMLTARGLTFWAAKVDPTNAMAISEGIVMAVTSVAPTHAKMLTDFSGGQSHLEGGGIDFSDPAAQSVLTSMIYNADTQAGVPHLTQEVYDSIVSGTTEPLKVWEVAGLGRLPSVWDVIDATDWTMPGGGN